MDDIVEVRDRDAGLGVNSKRAEIVMHVPAISFHYIQNSASKYNLQLHSTVFNTFTLN